MRFFALACCLWPIFLLRAEVDAYIFGLSWHDRHGMNPYNQGAGVGYSQEIASKIHAGGVCGWYVDSYDNMAMFAMPSVRYDCTRNFSLDASLGYYQGSDFHGLGGLASASVRVAGPVWLHITAKPNLRGHDGTAMAAAYLRIQLLGVDDV